MNKHYDTIHNRRILIVDDNPSIHADFRKILAREETYGGELATAEAELFGETPAPARRPVFELTCASQGQEGLAVVAQAVETGQPFAIAFVDVRMPPGWDGIETTARLWQADPDLQIVICTAYSDYSWDEMTARLGTSDRMLILKKPFDAVEVLQLANTLAEKWSLLQQTKLRFQDLEHAIRERTRELESSNARLRTEVRERELTEQLLRGVQDKLNHFLTKSPAVLYSLRKESDHWVPVWISDNFTHFTGRPLQAWYQETLDLAYVPEADRPAVLENFDTLLAQNHSSLQYQVRRQDGTLRWVRDDRQLLRDEDCQAVEIVGCWTDITEQRQLEEELRQSQKMESVGLLAGGIAHDFNNMLTVMCCHVGMLLDTGKFSGETADSLREIQAATERAIDLTRQLLAFSRKQVMRPAELDLNKLAGSLVKLLTRTLGEHILLKMENAPELPSVWVDRGMIEQVIMNFAVNARDAMPNGGQLIFSTSACEIAANHVLDHPEAREGHFVCLSVSDTGTGIPPETLPRIFEPFFTTKEIGKGTGLGLATVYGIIKQHDGWLEVESQVGRGTTFKAFLPVATPKETGAATALSPASVPLGGSETILVVEDEPALRGLVRTTLQRQGYRVFTASSGAEAIQAWSNRLHQIDLLLTDMVMPDGVTGRELAEKWLAQQPGMKTIYMSGYSTEFYGRKPNASRDVSFLAKPFGPQSLAKAVRDCLDGRGNAIGSMAVPAATAVLS